MQSPATQREVMVVSGVRTAIGDFGGALKDMAPTALAAQVVREALARAGVDGAEVGHVVFGNVIHTEPKDMYMARVAALDAGVTQDAPALTVNRLCGSGLQAIVSAAQSILLGDADIAVGGGAESMSRAPYMAQGMRWGARMGDATMIDMMVAALHDPFDNIHMGETAENLAESHQITRGAQDGLAVESHRRAAHAIAEGRFKSQILPITFTQCKNCPPGAEHLFPKMREAVMRPARIDEDFFVAPSARRNQDYKNKQENYFHGRPIVWTSARKRE